MTEQLNIILSKALLDLSANHTGKASTSYYQFNSTGWSFEVALDAPEELPYGLLYKTASFILSSLPNATTQNVTRTRVACIDRKGVPMANVAFIPMNEDTSDPAGTTKSSSTPGPAIGDQLLFETLTVHGSSSQTQFLGPHTLDFFNTTATSTGLRPRQAGGLEREIFLTIGNSLAYVVARPAVARELDTPVVRLTSALIIAYTLRLALTEISLQDQAEIYLAPDIKVLSYHFELVLVRFAISLTSMPVGTWAESVGNISYQIGMAFLKELDKSKPQAKIPSLEGWIFAIVPDGNGTVQSKQVGSWELVSQKAPPVDLHDELKRLA